MALFYFIRQRRIGAKQAKVENERLEKERREIDQLRQKGIDPDSFVVENSEYNPQKMTRDGTVHRDSYSVPTTPITAAALANTKTSHDNRWGATGADAAAAMRSPMPLLRDGSQSPRVASPGPMGPYGPGSIQMDRLRGDTRSPAHLVSPLRTPSPGMPPNFPPPASPHRSATNPNAYMRMDSPGPQQHFGSRTQSPAPMNHSNRSYTAPREDYGFGGGHQQQQQYGNHGGYNQGPRGNGNNGYWNGSGY
jgi:hypothetical protein